MIKLNCQVCGNEYFRSPYAAKKSKHCSLVCHNKVAGRIGGKAKKPGINRGIKRPGLTLRNLLNNPCKKGVENSMWKADNVGYIALHNWAHKYVGLKKICSQCGSSLNLEMANKSQEYKRELEDWLTLCRKCHRARDAEFRRNGGVSRKLHRWKKQKPL